MEKEEYFNTKEVAKYMKISPRTIERWRTEGQGPEYHKVGRKVIYNVSDINAYLASNKYSHTSQY